MNKKFLISDYFPLTVASGPAFCNRIEEISKLRGYILNKRPTLVISPRRYGKTSLVLEVVQQTKLLYANIDLFSVIDEQDIEKALLRGVCGLIQAMESIPKRALALASSIFEGIHLRAYIGNLGISIEVQQRKEKPAYHILDILERLDKLAQKTNKTIILFFDEFQCIQEVTQNHAIESVIRQVAQLTKSISFIFSGSNRHLLAQLFDDRSRPFYKLCERISLERISKAAYKKHLQKIAKKKWQHELPKEVLDMIFYYTEEHPYYINQLCSRLWSQKGPTVEAVNIIWQQYIKEERSHVAAEIELLSKYQRKLLTVLARNNKTDEILGQEFVQIANMAKTTISQTINTLEKKDYVFRDEHGFMRILDPLIKYTLSQEQ